jgi:phosphohistidine phosphatase SixA
VRGKLLRRCCGRRGTGCVRELIGLSPKHSSASTSRACSRGNVRIDTIFIDEGFGSLDADSDGATLNQVLETLQHLVSQNRTMGLISHVPLVQEAIPKFWISKTAGGSKIEMRSSATTQRLTQRVGDPQQHSES